MITAIISLVAGLDPCRRLLSSVRAGCCIVASINAAHAGDRGGCLCGLLKSFGGDADADRQGRRRNGSGPEADPKRLRRNHAMARRCWARAAPLRRAGVNFGVVPFWICSHRAVGGRASRPHDRGELHPLIRLNKMNCLGRPN